MTRRLVDATARPLQRPGALPPAQLPDIAPAPSATRGCLHAGKHDLPRGVSEQELPPLNTLPTALRPGMATLQGQDVPNLTHFRSKRLPAISIPTEYPAAMTVVDMVWPDQSNHHGTLFGGAALAILDRMAFMMGSKALRGSVVTAAVGQLNFTAPAPAGHLVECRATVRQRGRRSVTIDTHLVAEDLLSGARTDCLSGEFVMVRQTRDDEPIEGAGMPVTVADADGDGDASGFTTAQVAEIVFPGHANHRGLLHGGPAMAWMAKAGFVAATRQVRRTVVMAASEKLDFRAPAHVGEVVEVSARVTSVGRRSVKVQVEMWAEAPSTGERRHCTSGRLVFVAVD